MSKLSQAYVCSNCDAQFPKWNGRCLECGQWGTLRLEIVAENSTKPTATAAPAQAISLSEISTLNKPRLYTKIEEIDRVFGNGLVRGSLTLLGGEPGIGKSTLVAQIANALQADYNVLYVSGEESVEQVKLRLDRLSCQVNRLQFIIDTNTEKIIAAAQELRPQLLIIDSIQTVYSAEAPAEAGSVSQIRASAGQFLSLAKNHDIAVILIGHITKDGSLAGPKTLEHLVDTVLYLETDASQAYRFLRTSKNRFGSTNELGVFEMTGQGLKPVANPTSLFLQTNSQPIPGSVISSIIEGTRPFLVEIQALVSRTVFGYPQRKASGFDVNRLQVLAAVLSKRTNLNLTNQDIILNIVGGLKLTDPGLDLAICAAIASSYYNQALDSKTLVLGEVGLGGEVRPIARLQDKIKEAQKLGFQQVWAPGGTKLDNQIAIKPVNNLQQLIDCLKSFND